MKVYLVTYDLNVAGQNYEDLIKAIKQYSWMKAMQSVWFIKSDKSANDISDHLRKAMDSNDYIFVSEVTWNCQGWLPQTVWDFINGE